MLLHVTAKHIEIFIVYLTWTQERAISRISWVVGGDKADREFLRGWGMVFTYFISMSNKIGI